MTNEEKAKELFKSGYNCAQSVFAVYAERYGIDFETALKLSSSFGGGMGRLREVCGAVSGMFMAAGLATGYCSIMIKMRKKHIMREFNIWLESLKSFTGRLFVVNF